MSPNDSVWQGVLLGLGDDGTTYHCQGDTWQPYIPPLNPQDKAAELNAARAEIERLDTAGIHSCHKDCQRPNCVLRRELKAVTEQRDRLEVALQKLADCDWIITPHDRMDAVRTIARKALQSLTTNEL